MVNMCLMEIAIQSFHCCYSAEVEVRKTFDLIRIFELQRQHLCRARALGGQQHTSDSALRVLERYRGISAIYIERSTPQEGWLALQPFAECLCPQCAAVVIWPKGAIDEEADRRCAGKRRSCANNGGR